MGNTQMGLLASVESSKHGIRQIDANIYYVTILQQFKADKQTNKTHESSHFGNSLSELTHN